MDSVTNSLQDLTLGQVPVYLLKTPSNPSDSYHTHFSASPFKPIFVPVLEHLFRDDALRTLRRAAERFAFASGSEATARHKAAPNLARKYSGIIFTSQRAVDAFSLVVSKLDPAKRQTSTIFDPEMPIYVVGSATARGIQALELPCPVVGEESGNGEALATFILSHHPTLPPSLTHVDDYKLPLLFLVGEQRRDIIPKTLGDETLPASQQIDVVEVVVYETGEMATFEEDLTLLLRQARTNKVAEQWVVVFSPQGCEAMLNALGWLDESGKYSAGRREVVQGPTATRIATIGPTTRDHLVEQFGFTPDAVAVEPSPDGVGEAIRQFRDENPIS